MSVHDVQRIAEAEEAALRMKIDSLANAAKLTEAVLKDCLEAITVARLQAEDETSALKQELESKAKIKGIEMMSSTLNRCAAMRVHAESRYEAVARRIVDAVADL